MAFISTSHTLYAYCHFISSPNMIKSL